MGHGQRFAAALPRPGLHGQRERIGFERVGSAHRASGLLGPDAAPPATATVTNLDWLTFRDTARDVLEFIQTERRVPARVFIGPDPVAPADFLVAMAAVWNWSREHSQRPPALTVSLGRDVRILPERYVAKDTP